MKRQILLCISALLMLSTSSCSNDETLVETHTQNPSSENLTLLENNKVFGAYNALGYGYNATGEYANTNATGSKVINIDLFQAEQSARLLDENTLSQEYSEEYGADAVAFSKVISKKVSATEQMQLYGKTISSIINSATTNSPTLFDAKYIYGSYNLIIKQKRYRLNTTPDMLSNYLTQGFLQDLQSKTPEQIVRDYGTHVTVDIYTGAKVDMIFQAQTTNPDRQRAARAGVMTVINTLNSNVSNDADAQEASKNYSKKLYCVTRGGDKSKGFAKVFNLDQPNSKINISEWQSTSTKDNSVLVDFGTNGLVLIYDVIKDPSKKAQLKSYVDQYLTNNQVFLASH
ncbi:MAC/perforin domain-containing protein [Chryseobacterium aurantiacum]|uniref:MAC/perforin domain-containing protein n=1 Tax=Chryseobacterium aurantiacum TaxID=2116499 RepID=UPI000D130ED8|nr:MAC/perforin domain-containing protein [Chryseobacterium aurantiacum]